MIQVFIDMKNKTRRWAPKIIIKPLPADFPYLVTAKSVPDKTHANAD